VRNRDGHGVHPDAIAEARNNPLQVVPQGGRRVRYHGPNATVVVNKQGKVVTAWATNSKGWDH
jgi:hypothetical protein